MTRLSVGLSNAILDGTPLSVTSRIPSLVTLLSWYSKQQSYIKYNSFHASDSFYGETFTVDFSVEIIAAKVKLTLLFVRGTQENSNLKLCMNYVTLCLCKPENRSFVWSDLRSILI